MQHRDYIPAFGYAPLTPLYDPVVQWTTREQLVKGRLVEQADVRPGMRVLDVGCGTGTLAIRAKQTQPDADIIGLDGDAAILRRAQRKAERQGVAVTFAQGLSVALPYPDHTFDRVLSSLLFHHLTTRDKGRTLADMQRVLRPGGELHIADWGTADTWVMRSAFLLIQVLDGFTTTRDNVTGKLVPLMRDAAFSEVHETMRVNTVFGTLSLYHASKPRQSDA